MSVPVDRKPERAVQEKIRGIQKIYSRWIENPKGRSRQKLEIFRKIIQKKIKKNYKKKKKNKQKKIEASHFKWVKWKNALCVGLQMATSACGSIDGDFCLWFDEWRLLPMV